MKKQLMRTVALLCVCLLVGGLTAAAERPQGFDANGRMALITEPGESAQQLIYCRGDRDLSIDEVNWVDTGNGKAVQLNGVDEYFRIPYKSLQVSSFTLSMWVNWQGTSPADGGSGLANQRIFSARANQYGKRYITLSPMETTAEGTDALRLHMRFDNADWDLHRPEATPLSQGTWHHIAIVATPDTLALYLDGNLMDEQETATHPVHSNWFQFYLGKGPTMGGDGYFYGMMRQVYLHKQPLTIDEIRSDILEQHQPTTTTTTPAPTTNTTTKNSTEVIPAIDQTGDTTLPPIPPIVWIVSGATAGVILLFIAVVNLRDMRRNRKKKE